jgi:hypothetical protein
MVKGQKKTVRVGVAAPGYEATSVKGVYRQAKSASTASPLTLSDQQTSRDPDDVFGAIPLGRVPGQWQIISESTHPRPTTVDGVTTIRVTTGGEPKTNAVMGAAISMFTDSDRDAAADEAFQLAKAGKRMTVLVASKDGRYVTAMEMKGSVGVDATPLSAVGTMKDTRDEWVRLSYLNILSVEPGYGQQDVLAAQFDERAARAPVFEDEPARQRPGLSRIR